MSRRPAAAADTDEDDAGATAATDAVASAGQAVNPSPQAAAIAMPNAAATDVTPAGRSASAADLAIGGQPRARLNQGRAASQDSQVAATAQQAAPTADAQAAADAAAVEPTPSIPATAGTPTPSNASTQQGPADPAPPQGDVAASATTELPVARMGAVAAPTVPTGSGPGNAQGATAAVQSATANLPAFGIAAATGATGQAAAASANSPAGAVPLSGLPIAIAARVQAGLQQFDIRLDPPELGRIDVRLGVDGNGQVTSHVTVDRPETLNLLQSQQPQLERALEQAGLKTADNGLQFSLRDQSFAGGNGGGAQDSSSPQLVLPDADASPVETSQIYSRRSLGTGVDIRV